jgi:hypothetical protein
LWQTINRPGRREACEVAAQPAVSEVLKRRVRAVVAVEPLEHDLVAGERRALEIFVALTLGDPALRRLEQGGDMSRVVLWLGSQAQLVQLRRQELCL